MPGNGQRSAVSGQRSGADRRQEPGELSERERSIIDEEERLLAAAQAAVRARRPARSRDRDDLRRLREEAAHASADDLPSVLHDLAVEHRLAHRDGEPDIALEAPYFAHLRVEEAGRVRDHLLGPATLIEGDVRIVDWRVAPIARVFYLHREGDEYELELPNRTAEGRVIARRRLGIERGKLVRIDTDELSLMREGDEWRSVDAGTIAAGGTGAAVRSLDVTASLDRDQWTAIEAPRDRALVVLGSAGSGKTTVALHRLARLGGGSVVVPEEGLARLARRLLAPLGEGNVRTLDAWAEAVVKQTFGLRKLRLSDDTPGLVSSLKRHPATYRALSARVDLDGGGERSFEKLRRRLHRFFTDRELLAECGHSRAAIEETVRHTRLQMVEPTSKQLAAITDREAKRTIDGRGVAAGTPDALAGSVDREDLPILLAMVELDVPALPHLVIDEAEDASLFELSVLGRTLDRKRSVTLAGDEAQQTTSSFAGWDAACAALAVRDVDTVRLPVSYRCPRPVAELARAVLGELAPKVPATIVREGPPVERRAFGRTEEAFLYVADAVAELVRREPRASIAILARDGDAAAAIAPLIDGGTLVTDGAFSFEPGVEIADVDAAKGLEFDYVFVPDATAQAYPGTDESRRRLHVAVTRAAHQLVLASGGAISPLLALQCDA